MKRIICIIMAAMLCMTAFVGCGGSKDSYDNWDCEPLIEQMKSYLKTVPLGAEKGKVEEVFGKPDNETENEYIYNIKTKSYDSDCEYAGHIRVAFKDDLVSRIYWEYSSDENEDLNVYVFAKDEVKDCVKELYSDWNVSSDNNDGLKLAKTIDNKHAEITLSPARGKINSFNMWFTGNTSGNSKEDTSDGVVGDNNGDGVIDEKDWEIEMKDYLDKKMN